MINLFKAITQEIIACALCGGVLVVWYQVFYKKIVKSFFSININFLYRRMFRWNPEIS